MLEMISEVRAIEAPQTNRDSLFDGLTLTVVDVEASLDMTTRSTGDIVATARTEKGACRLVFPADRLGTAFEDLQRLLEGRSAELHTLPGKTFANIVVHGAWKRHPMRDGGRFTWGWDLVVAEFGFLGTSGDMMRGGRVPAPPLAA